MDFNNKKKRKAQTIQEVFSADGSDKRAIRYSGYQGTDNTNDIQNMKRQSNGQYVVRTPMDTGTSLFRGMIDYAWIIYSVLLFICLLVACIVYYAGKGGTVNRDDYMYPSYVYTINGVLTDIYTGKYDVKNISEGGMDVANYENMTESNEDGEFGLNGHPNSNSDVNIGMAGGATMPLDDGTFELAFPEANSHEELISQLESALASADIKFVGSKIGYGGENDIIGYPESVVETFVAYMASAADKRNTFIDSIKSEEKYSKKNGEAYIISLPMISYKIRTDYEDTAFTISGFGEQIINPGQLATVQPLLPCMYHISATSPTWDEPIEGDIEATYGENLEVNFGKKE